MRPRPRFRASAGVLFPTFEAGATAVRALAQSGLYPSNCRLLDPDEATLTGAAAVGWYAGQLAVVAGGLSLVANQDRVWRLAVLVGAAVVLAIAGLLAQHWCRVDPRDDDD